MSSRLSRHLWLGRVSFQEGISRQESEFARLKDGADGVSLIGMELHSTVITLGRNAHPGNILNPQGVEVVATDRGGQATLHLPGQLICYVVSPIRSVKQHIAWLEEASIRLLAKHGIDASRDEEYPGVWVGTAKICAVGVRVRERISLHGIALNVNCDVSQFSRIVPCGIKNRQVTSMSDTAGPVSLSLEALFEQWCSLWQEVSQMPVAPARSVSNP